MEAVIHYRELQSWQNRHNAGEIYMTGLAPTKNGYRLTYQETPHMRINQLESSERCSSDNAKLK